MCRRTLAGALAALVATHAAAQPAVAPPDPPFSLVADRLTFGEVFLHADGLMKLVLFGLALAALAGVAVWAGQALRLRRGAGSGVAGAVAYLSALGAAAPLIGAAGASYTLLHAALGLANTRPTPTLGVVAPGLAEALLALALGFLAAAIGVAGHRHLKLRLYAMDSRQPASDAPAPAARLVRAG